MSAEADPISPISRPPARSGQPGARACSIDTLYVSFVSAIPLAVQSADTLESQRKAQLSQSGVQSLLLRVDEHQCMAHANGGLPLALLLPARKREEELEVRLEGQLEPLAYTFIITRGAHSVRIGSEDTAVWRELSMKVAACRSRRTAATSEPAWSHNPVPSRCPYNRSTVRHV